MSKTDIDFEIQKKLLEKVYQRLDFQSVPKIKEIDISKKVGDVLNDIERKEKTWELRLDSKTKIHGQKEVGEPIRFWSVPKDSAEFLMYFVASLKSKSLLEIGTSVGYSTMHLALGTGATVVSLESLHDKVVLARQNFEKAGFTNITLIEGSAKSYLSKLPPDMIFDFVFLDADKENYGRYFDTLMTHMPIGGVIVADNILDYGHAMQDFLSKVMGTKFAQSSSDRRVISFLLPIDNGLLIIKKVAE